MSSCKSVRAFWRSSSEQNLEELAIAGLISRLQAPLVLSICRDAAPLQLQINSMVDCFRRSAKKIRAQSVSIYGPRLTPSCSPGRGSPIRSQPRIALGFEPHGGPKFSPNLVLKKPDPSISHGPQPMAKARAPLPRRPPALYKDPVPRFHPQPHRTASPRAAARRPSPCPLLRSDQR